MILNKKQSMLINKTKIAGVYTIDLELKTDGRGNFTRVFCQKELKNVGINFNIAQINRSLSVRRGMIRGLHMQKSPKSEDKIVQCLAGKIFDVALDLRQNSKTFGQWFGQELSEKNKKIMVVPKGCAHGFQTLTDNCLVEYFVSQFYAPEFERGIRWDDPKFSIKWPYKNVVLSDKDSNWPLYK